MSIDSAEENVVVIVYRKPLEGRFMLDDLMYLEELNPKYKYEIWFNSELKKWMCHVIADWREE